MANRSTTETAAILEISKRSNIINEDHYRNDRELLIRMALAAH